MDEETRERRLRTREVDRTLQEILRGRLASSRFVLTAEGKVVRVEEPQPHSKETGGGEDES
jgi:hypothetical protein